MNIAVQLDGHEFRTLQQAGDELKARRISTDYLVVLGSAARRQLLQRQTSAFVQCDDGLILFGPDARELSELLGLPLQSALNDGKLRPNDPVSRQFLGSLIDELLPVPAVHSVCQIVASSEGDLDGGEVLESGLRFLVQLIKLRGYEPRLVSPGLALVLADCLQSHFSGIGVNLGQTVTDISIVHQTRELVRISIPRGGCHLDRRLASQGGYYLSLHDGQQVLDLRAAQAWRETVENLSQVTCPQTLELRNQYRELIAQVLHGLQRELLPGLSRKLPEQLPLVLGGPLASPAGVDVLFQQGLRDISSASRISSVRAVKDTGYAALKGGLIASGPLLSGRAA